MSGLPSSTDAVVFVRAIVTGRTPPRRTPGGRRCLSDRLHVHCGRNLEFPERLFWGWFTRRMGLGARR
jgi:hypothetical protein